MTKLSNAKTVKLNRIMEAEISVAFVFGLISLLIIAFGAITHNVVIGQVGACAFMATMVFTVFFFAIMTTLENREIKRMDFVIRD